MLKEAPVDEIKLDMGFLSAADPYGRARNPAHDHYYGKSYGSFPLLRKVWRPNSEGNASGGFGCNKAQGYFYAGPMREAEYTELLKKGKSRKF